MLVQYVRYSPIGEYLRLAIMRRLAEGPARVEEIDELAKVRAQLADVLPLAQRVASAEAQARDLASAVRRLGEELNSTKAELNATRVQLSSCRAALQSVQADAADKASQLSKCQADLMDAQNRVQLLLFAIIGMAILMVVYTVIGRLKK